MRLGTLLLVTLASSTAVANYDVKMYQVRWCLLKMGKICNNIGAGRCCGDGNQYRSAKFAEVGGGKSTDQLKLYQDSKCGGAAIMQQAGTGCVSDDKKEVQGAAVFVIVKSNDEEITRPAEVVEPDEAFLEEGPFKYTVKRDSPEGRAYDKLDRVEDQIEYLRNFGKREEIPEGVDSEAS
ncbi:uncharacterized protein F4807DRAFT_464325 [Annulohypoxylon truncatum]|uniref:uncharacterized protein n=1 Tax=Annulohypoxylon truncatum TaxID=327061 RepID=UPI002008AD8A|nr:uncharacterized protein F4807DRAFT_464325 [Annulohypoxylon truncatum]KAI1205864.1 hypothetical protein F4807DRAFT_464325 [Annulohypoxylon truncatum]